MVPLNSHQTFTQKFFQPLKEHPVCTVAASVIIGLGLYIGVDIGLAEVVRQNSYPIQMLSAELLIEHGPEYVDDAGRYTEIINQYIDYLEQRDFAAILRILYPEYSPKKALTSTLSGFKKVEEAAEDKKEEEAKKALWQAGVKINQFSIRAERFPRSPIAWLKSEDVPRSLLMKLDNEFDTFHEHVVNLEKVQTQKTAVDECRRACRYSRNVVLLLFLARLGYDDDEGRIERFISDVKRAHDLALLFAKKYPIEKELFESRAENMSLRAEVVGAMLANDMDRVSDLLREVIEKAIAAKQKEKAKSAQQVAPQLDEPEPQVDEPEQEVNEPKPRQLCEPPKRNKLEE